MSDGAARKGGRGLIKRQRMHAGESTSNIAACELIGRRI